MFCWKQKRRTSFRERLRKILAYENRLGTYLWKDCSRGGGLLLIYSTLHFLSGLLSYWLFYNALKHRSIFMFSDGAEVASYGIFIPFFFFVVVSTLLFLVRVFLTLAWVRTVQQVYKFKLQLNEDSTFKQKKNLIVMSAHGIFIKCVFPFLFFVLLLFLFFRHSFCTCSLWIFFHCLLRLSAYDLFSHSNQRSYQRLNQSVDQLIRSTN